MNDLDDMEGADTGSSTENPMLDPDLGADSRGKKFGFANESATKTNRLLRGKRVVNTHRYMAYTFRGIVKPSGASKDTKNTCAFCTPNWEFMATRLPISMDIKHKKYSGEYEIDHGVLYVFFEDRNKSSAVTGPNPELLARLLLIELVFQAPSWREPNNFSSDSIARLR